jgi:prepilin-type N-terminal cleavage/methylation domain-containing protein
MQAERRCLAVRAERSRRAFTLLEVLAAVAVMGLVYSVLATAAIQGLRAEGDAGRRLRASLLADQRISEIETRVSLGQTPEIGETEDQDDEFAIRTEVKPLDLEIGESKASKRATTRLERAVGAREKKAPGEVGSLLRPSGASKQPMLRRIELVVAWGDAENEQSVRRTTFGLDAVAAAPLIEELASAAEAEKAEDLERSQKASQAAADGQQPVEGTATGSATRVPAQRLRATSPTGTDPSGATGTDR